MMWSELGEEHKTWEIYENQLLRNLVLWISRSGTFFRIHATLYHCDAAFISFILKIY